jgi:hypothetical protein
MKSQQIELTPNITTNAYGSFINCNSIKNAGNYSILQDEQVKTMISANYDRAESQLIYPSNDELKQKFSGCQVTNNEADAFAYINKSSENKLLQNWQLCLMIALFFLAIEILISRLLR